MQVSVVPLTSFVHGGITAREGRPLDMPEGVARDLERAGLIRISYAPKPEAESVKRADDGQGQPSSSSHPAPASAPMTSQTLHLSKTGAAKHRKAGK